MALTAERLTGRSVYLLSVVRFGLCIIVLSPVGASDGSPGIYPTGWKCHIFIRHVRDDVNYYRHFRGINSPATINLSLCDVSNNQTGHC